MSYVFPGRGWLRTYMKWQIVRTTIQTTRPGRHMDTYAATDTYRYTQSQTQTTYRHTHRQAGRQAGRQATEETNTHERTRAHARTNTPCAPLVSHEFRIVCSVALHARWSRTMFYNNSKSIIPMNVGWFCMFSNNSKTFRVNSNGQVYDVYMNRWVV